MPYTVAWQESVPAGTAQARDIDTFIQNDKIAVRERLQDMFNVDLRTVTTSDTVYVDQLRLGPVNTLRARISSPALNDIRLSDGAGTGYARTLLGSIVFNTPATAARFRNTIDVDASDDLGIFRSGSTWALAGWLTGQGVLINTVTGAFGIGATPDYRLHVAAPTATDADILLVGMTGVTNGLTYRRIASTFEFRVTAGNVIIPAGNLQVDSSYVRTPSLWRNNTNSNARITISNTTSTFNWSLLTALGQNTIYEIAFTSGAGGIITVNLPTATEIETLTGLNTRGHAVIFLRFVNTSGAVADIRWPAGVNWSALGTLQFNLSNNESIVYPIYFFRNTSGSIMAVRGSDIIYNNSTNGIGTASIVN